MRFSFVVAFLICFCFDVNSQSIVSLKKATESWAYLFVSKDGRYVHCEHCEDKDFKNCNDEYIIIPFEGQSQAQLYKKMMMALNDVYVDIDKVVTKIEPEAITVNGIATSDNKELGFFVIKIDDQLYQSDYVNYRLSFKFKDGKLRIDAPINTTMNFYPYKKKDLSKIVPFETCNKDWLFCTGVTMVVGELLIKILKKMSTSNDEW